MAKKGLLILSLILVLSLFFVSAANETVEQKAYSCLEDKISSNGCSALSAEEKIFSLLAVGKCKTELLADASENECWPKGGCKIKTTAQAILALSKTGSATSQAESWLSLRNTSFLDIDWFLQVESANRTTCTAVYSGNSYSFTLNEDKTLSGSAGTCLTRYQNYWFKVSPTCYSREFELSCSNSFSTSLLYKREDSSTFYVSDKLNSASGEGKTKEKVNSLCFAEGAVCNYEGTLWAATVLKFKGKDISSFIPYLVSMAEENSKFVPESFLYILTDNFRTDLLANQEENKWWDASGDKFYDTAVALLPFQSELSLIEKTNSIGWLGEVQDNDGCWQGNIRNTAFLLYSLWPKTVFDLEPTLNCEDSNHFCLSRAACSDVEGEVFENYTGCFGTNICCSKTKPLESCSEQNGELCSSGEDCLGGSLVSSSDSPSSKSCCVDGECGIPTVSQCENMGGTCRSTCSSGEEFASYSCPISGVCCTDKKESNAWVIIVLIFLIILVALGIIFRKKIREFFVRFKSGKGKPATSGSPRFPPTSSSRVYPGAVPRRIIPSQGQPVRRPVQQKSDVDDVLKKLKEIGK